MIAALRRLGLARGAAALVALGAAWGSTSCIDPVHSDAVAALGGEVSGQRPGPSHRPGQDCLVCHGGSGPGSPDFTVAGTVYATRGSTTPLGGVNVVLTDANNATKTVVSNGAGNFYITASQWSPATPIAVKLEYGDKTKVMKSRIGGFGGCALCHYGADNDPTHMPPVFMSDQ